jgi:hypothetical protein
MQRRIEIDILSDMMDQYNRNQLQYNRNMDKMITAYNLLIERQTLPRTIPRTAATTSRRTNTLTSSPLFTNIPISTTTTTTAENTGLTETEIQENTQIISYSLDMQETICPISHENFEEGEQIVRINHCEHIFKTEPIMRWFRQNKRCPVCRHQLSSTAPTTSLSSSLTSLPALETSIIQNLNRIFSDEIRSFSFEIPLYTFDASFSSIS